MISLALLSEWKEVFLMKGNKNLVQASWQDFKNQQHPSAQPQVVILICVTITPSWQVCETTLDLKSS